MSRPKIPEELKRVNRSVTLAPTTDQFLCDQPEALGRTIDFLVQRYIDELLKEEK